MVRGRGPMPKHLDVVLEVWECKEWRLSSRGSKKPFVYIFILPLPSCNQFDHSLPATNSTSCHREAACSYSTCFSMIAFMRAKEPKPLSSVQPMYASFIRSWICCRRKPEAIHVDCLLAIEESRREESAGRFIRRRNRSQTDEQLAFDARCISLNQLQETSCLMT